MIGLILLIAVPLIELALLIKVAKLAGFWPTLLWVMGTFVLGASVIARSGVSSAIRLREAMLKGEAPVKAMVESTLVVIAGVLLMTPGLIADACGIVLLMPQVRAIAAEWLLRKTAWFGQSGFGQSGMRSGESRAEGAFGTGPETRGDGEAKAGPIIEGEFERLDERPLDERGQDARGPRKPR